MEDIIGAVISFVGGMLTRFVSKKGYSPTKSFFIGFIYAFVALISGCFIFSIFAPDITDRNIDMFMIVIMAGSILCGSILAFYAAHK